MFSQNHVRFIVLSTFLISLFLFFVSCQQESGTSDEPQGRSLDYDSTVSFLDESGEVIVTIEAAVADDNASRSSGLMDVFDIPMDKGMFFIFPDEAQRSFWMANTPLSLDIIFVNSALEIVRIHRNTQPFSDQSILSEQPARYVIETNAGFTLNHDITEGMRIEFERNQQEGEE